MYEVLAPTLVFDITVEVLKKGRNVWLGNIEQASWNRLSTFKISPSVPARASADGRVNSETTRSLLVSFHALP